MSSVFPAFPGHSRSFSFIPVLFSFIPVHSRSILVHSCSLPFYSRSILGCSRAGRLRAPTVYARRRGRTPADPGPPPRPPAPRLPPPPPGPLPRPEVSPPCIGIDARARVPSWAFPPASGRSAAGADADGVADARREWDEKDWRCAENRTGMNENRTGTNENRTGMDENRTGMNENRTGMNGNERE